MQVQTSLPLVCSSPMLFGPTEEASYSSGTVIQLEYAVCCCIARTLRRLRNARGPIVLNSNLRDAAIRHQIERSTITTRVQNEE
jgi:hypothetical protein